MTFDDLRIGMKVSVNTSLREKISTITEGDPYYELFTIDGYNEWFSVNDINVEKTKELNRTTLSKEAEKLKESVKNFGKLNDTINESLEMLKKRKDCTDKKIERFEEIIEDRPDAIKPNHYKMAINGIDIEARDIMQAVATEEEYNGFLYCNVIKYVLRAKRKNGIEDLKKAKLYLKWLIEEKETKE